MSEDEILLVDDDPDNSALALYALQEQGLTYKVRVVRDGLAALEYLFGPQADLARTVVLLDLRMPRMDGFETLRRIRADARTRRLPVIILTSSDREDDIASSYRDGADGYVCKPVSYADFGRAIQVLTVYWLDLNRRVTGGRP